MDNTTTNTDQIKTDNISEQVNLPKNPKIKKKYLISAIFAAILVLVVAAGSFYFVRNLNLAPTPNAPASEPQAAAKAPIKSWNGGKNCNQGCGTNEYCENGRCRKSGGSGDTRSPEQVAAGAGTKLVNPTTYKFDPNTYVCTPQNCPSPDFFCKNGNTCVNAKNQSLSIANDPMNCGGATTSKIDNTCNVGETCIMGVCVSLSEYKCDEQKNCKPPYKCMDGEDMVMHCVYKDITIKPTAYVTVISAGGITPTKTPTPGVTLTMFNDPNNCGNVGWVCPIGKQKCVDGVCVNDGGTVSCEGILADDGTHPDPSKSTSGQAKFRTCCVPGGLGVDPTQLDDKGMVDVDKRVHWTNCAEGTTCVQGKGCFGAPVKTPEKTTNEVTTTTTISPTKIPTGTTSPTITTTVTIPPTVTATPTGTVTVTTTPTIAVCNESCSEDEDCSDGLYCDSDTNKCRKEECSSESSCVCPTETPEPTIVDCNYKCKTDDNCSSGLICDSDSGRCRKAACSDEKDCSCPKPRKTDAPTREITTRRTATRTTVLKEAGILDFPGAAVFGSGLLLTVIGILLAL